MKGVIRKWIPNALSELDRTIQDEDLWVSLEASVIRGSKGSRSRRME